MTGHRQPEPESGPDLGVLTARILFSVQRELFATLAERGFDDILPRSGAVLAHLRPDGIRASELARLSGQHKQVVGTLVDDLERLGYVERVPDPADRRAKLVRPTERGLLQMETATAIMRAIEGRHAESLGEEAYATFKDALGQVARTRGATAEGPG
ncbi:MarR family winged helix-turn-helix transcriptional regulator [Streptomyces sp. NPDC088557]|uniref:MarR family winged helix-turn-helix transcriptional regulator n=1 Tax=Streptomyces sp. NPDC088557 TaxID=3365867 RepID=UPI00382410F0